MARPSFLRLKLIGEPSWGVEEYFEDHAVEPGDSKVFIGFYASFSLPPLDDPAHVVFTQGAFSAPLHALMAAGQDLEAEREARDMIDRMLEEVRLPNIPSIVDHILDRVSRLDEPCQTATAAGALWMIFYIDIALHQMPSILLEYEEEEYEEDIEEEEEEEEVTDISDLLNSGHNKRVIVVVHRLFPDHLYHLSYEQRELIIRTETLPYFEFYDDGEYEDEYGVVDPDFDDEDFVIGFRAASEESVEGKLEKLRIDGNVENQPTITCSVCFDEIPAGTEAIRLPCSHHFHGDCIDQWLETSKLCPVCRFEKWLSS